MRYETFQNQLLRLSEGFSHELTPEQVAVYWERLRSHSDETFDAAIGRALDTQRRFPVIATLHGLCDRVRDERAAQERDEREKNGQLRIASGRTKPIPICGVCLDVGWVRVESAFDNLPTSLEPCPSCEIRSSDKRTFVALQESAMIYDAERGQAKKRTIVYQETAQTMGTPPESFAKREMPAVPTMPGEEKKERAKREMLRMAEKMRMHTTTNDETRAQ